MAMTELGKRIKFLCKDRKVTQRSVEDAMDMERSKLSRYIYGENEPNTYNLCKIADGLDTTMDFLYGRNLWHDLRKNPEDLPNKNENGESDDVLVYIPKIDGNFQHGTFIGRLRHIPGDDGSHNIFHIATRASDWSVSGWSYYEHPDVIAWKKIDRFEEQFGVDSM